jgi:site-specific recombinase XerD
MTPHMLRHSFATHQIVGGLGLEELRRLLGHASIATTQVYTQLATPHSPEENNESSRLALSSTN